MFRKRNPNNNNALLCEAEGLKLLTDAIKQNHIGEISTPEIHECTRRELLLSQIDRVNPTAKHFQNLASGLAQIHNIKQPYYGFPSDNYIGLSPQYNELCNNWGAFFVNFRLIPQIQMIKNKDVVQQFKNTVEQKHPQLIEFLSATCTHASVLHGDLWSGNVLYENESKVYLIDPAVYFGDSEADIAMTEMFGGFSDVFYHHYNALRPLHTEYPIKRQIFNFYHFLNHYNLFGNSYLWSCQQHLQTIENL